jgi:hypothetical protein
VGPKVADDPGEHQPLNWKSISLAWAPYAIMSILLLLTGLIRQAEGRSPGKIMVGPVATNYIIPIPGLNSEVNRDPRLQAIRTDQLACLALSSPMPLNAVVNVYVARSKAPPPDKAEFNFAWLTAPGTSVFVAALLSMIMLRHLADAHSHPDDLLHDGPEPGYPLRRHGCNARLRVCPDGSTLSILRGHAGLARRVPERTPAATPCSAACRRSRPRKSSRPASFNT